MSFLDILILAVVQGITEFLPISSSGHLVIVAELLGGVGARADVNIVLHAGTLLSILVYFRRRVARLVTHDRRVIPLLILGTLPAAAIGLTIRALNPRRPAPQPGSECRSRSGCPAGSDRRQRR